MSSSSVFTAGEAASESEQGCSSERANCVSIAFRLRERRVTEQRALSGTARMELLPHDEFSKLHIREFLPPEEIAEDDTGLEESPLGFCRCRHYFYRRGRQLAFFYPSSPPVTLAGIDLEVDESFSPEAAQRVLSACAPLLRLGMQEHEVVALFGSPEYSGGTGDYRFSRFRAGGRWPYRIGCGFRAASGLWSAWIVREDYYHEDDDV